MLRSVSAGMEASDVEVLLIPNCCLAPLVLQVNLAGGILDRRVLMDVAGCCRPAEAGVRA